MGKGTGFFMPRTAEDAAALRSKDRSSETKKSTSRDAGDEAKRGERVSHCRQTNKGGPKTASNTPSTRSTPAAQAVSRDAGLSTSQPSVHHLAVSCGNNLSRNRSFGNSRGMYGTKPLVRSVQSVTTATAPISTTSNADLNSNSSSWLPGGQSPAGGSHPNSEQLFSLDDAACCYSASAAGLHLSALPELLPPEASVSSWDVLDLLPQHSTTSASSRSGSSSSSLTPCVSPATLGATIPAAAPGPYGDYSSSIICGLDSRISCQGGPAAGDGPASDHMIIPHYSGSLLQSRALLSSSSTLHQQQQQQASAAAAGSPPALHTLLQLRSKLAAAQVPAEAAGGVCFASACNLSSSLLSTGLPASSCFSAPVNAGGLLGSSSAPAHSPLLLLGGLGCEQGASGQLFQCAFIVDMQPSLYNPAKVQSAQLSNDLGACFSGSFAQVAAGQPSASISSTFSPAEDMASQQLLGNDLGAVAAAIAQEKLQQLQQLEALQQLLRQEVVGLLPLI